jgi:hypothetical protein
MQLGMTANPVEDALAELRKHQEVMGMQFENPDAPADIPDKDGVPTWMTKDEEFR